MPHGEPHIKKPSCAKPGQNSCNAVQEEEWEDPEVWTPAELCHMAEGTIVFSDINLRADTAPTALLFQQVPALIVQLLHLLDSWCAAPVTTLDVDSWCAAPLDPVGVVFPLLLPCCWPPTFWNSVASQAAAVGMTHASVVRHLVSQAAMRRGLPPLPAPGTLFFAEDVLAVAEAEQVPCRGYFGCFGGG